MAITWIAELPRHGIEIFKPGGEDAVAVGEIGNDRSNPLLSFTHEEWTEFVEAVEEFLEAC